MARASLGARASATNQPLNVQILHIKRIFFAFCGRVGSYRMKLCSHPLIENAKKGDPRKSPTSSAQLPTRFAVRIRSAASAKVKTSTSPASRYAASSDISLANSSGVIDSQPSGSLVGSRGVCTRPIP
jgi:hypothetical protein